MVRGGPTPAQGFPLPLLSLPHEEQPQNPSPCGIPTTQGTNPHRRAIEPALGTLQAGPTPQGADSGNRQQAARRQTLITPQLKPPLNAAPTPASQPAAGQRRAPQPPRASPGGGGGSAQGPLRSERAPAGTQRPGTNVPRPKRSAPPSVPRPLVGTWPHVARTHTHTRTHKAGHGALSVAVMSQRRTALSRGGMAGWGQRRAAPGAMLQGSAGTWRCGAGMEARGSVGRSTAPWPRAPRHGGVTAGRPPPAVFPPRGPTRPSQAWRGGSGVGTAVWSGAAPLRGPRSTAPQGTAGCPLRGSLRPVRLLPHGAAPSPVQRSTAAWISHCAAPSVHGSLCVAQLLPHCIAPCPLQSAVPMHSSHQQDSYCTAPQCTAFNCTAPPCTASYCVMPSILHSSPVDCSSLHSSTLHGSLPTAQLPSHRTPL